MPIASRSWNSTPMKGTPSRAEVLKYNRLVGIEYECCIPDENSAEPHVPAECGAGYDGGGREIQTPPASADKLEKLIGQMDKALKAGRSYVTTGAGLHIHLDGTGFGDTASAIRLTNTYFVLEPIIWAMLPHSRRRNTYCEPMEKRISMSEYRQLVRTQSRRDKYYLHKKWYKSNNVSFFRNNHGKSGPRFYGFNLHALLAMKHLELRYHAGTVNPYKIRNWIWLHLHILNWVDKDYSRRKIENIRRAETLEEKMNLFFSYCKVPRYLQDYVKFRVRRCASASYLEEHDDWSYNDSILQSEEAIAKHLDPAITPKDNRLYSY